MVSNDRGVALRVASYTRTAPSRPIISVSSVFPLLAWLALVSILVWNREFSSHDGPRSPVYEPAIAGLRWIDIALLLFAYVAALPRLARRATGAFPASAVLALALFAVSVCMSLVVGFFGGGRQLFFDWRNVVLAICIAAIASSLLDRVDYRLALGILGAVVTVHAAYLLGRWFVIGGRGPYDAAVWDGPTISSFVALTSLSVARLLASRTTGLFLWLLALGAATGGIVAVASLRRTYWLELVIAVCILLFASTRRRLVTLTATALVVAFVIQVAPTGDLLATRSMTLLAPTDYDRPLAETNHDHINDVVDAVHAASQSPVLGLGQGIPYATERIRDWKAESWGVHNGPVHVWLRYGVLGVLGYFAFHVAVLRWLRRGASFAHDGSLLMGTFAYLCGVFVTSMAFSPWPYGSLQNAGLIALLLSICSRSMQSRVTRDVA